MAEEYKVHIRTTADAAGAEMTQDALEETARAGDKIVDAVTKGDRATAQFVQKLKTLTPEQISRVKAEMERLVAAEEEAGRDASALRAQLQNVADVDLEKQVKSVAGLFGSITAGALAATAITKVTSALTEHLRASIALSDELDDLKGRAGVTGSELQRLSNTAGQNNVSLAGTAEVLSKVRISAQDALAGGKALRENFERLGISVEDLNRLNPAELTYRIADAVQTSSDRGRTYADVVDVMGRGSKDFFATLELGGETIRKTGDAIGVFSDETIQKLAAAKDSLGAFQNQLTIYAGNAIQLLSDWKKFSTDTLTDSFSELFGLSAAEIEKFNAVQERAAAVAEKAATGFSEEAGELEALATAADTAAKTVQQINNAFAERAAKDLPIVAQLDRLRLLMSNIRADAARVLPDAMLRSAAEINAAANTLTDPQARARVQALAKEYARLEDAARTLSDTEKKAAVEGAKRTEGSTESAKNETKALTDSNTVLAERVRLLRLAQNLGSLTAGPKADELEGKPGPGRPEKVGKEYYEQVQRENPNDINAQLALASIAEKEEKALQLAKTTGEAAAKAIGGIGTATGEGLTKISTAAGEVTAALPPLFTPAATALSTDIPKAIAEGNKQLIDGAAKGIAEIRAVYRRDYDQIWEQIAALWRAV